MALLNPTFLLGVVVLLYLSSFVLFAVIRILTGISIQRIGYLSLRRLAYTPKDGCTVEIRGLGLHIHRPTFAQPTWLSIVLNELVVTLNVQELEGNKFTESSEESVTSSESESAKGPPPAKRPSMQRHADTPPRRDPWRQLSKIKDRIKRIHRMVKWLRMIDVVATNSTIHVVDVGNVQVGSITLAVDTRNKKVDRARFFHQKSNYYKHGHQAEWIVTIRSVLFTADGNESLEILDNALLNVHGFLHHSREGLRDATVALKLGRVHIPYDDLELCISQYNRCRRRATFYEPKDPVDISIRTPRQRSDIEEKDESGEEVPKAAPGSHDFFNSILHGIKEIQFAVSFISFNRRAHSVQPNAQPVLLSASMKEFGVDLHRLDPKSPSHRMYFPSTDVAHEGLAAALSLSVGIDDGNGRPERLLYIPMATTTIRTTLPSKTVQLSDDNHDSVEEKNANILFANSVVTSPSVDLDPAHLPLLIALLRSKPKPSRASRDSRSNLMSRFLPKANMKFSMHEPVIRIKLKTLEKTDDPDDFDLIISSISSISLDVESSHSPLEDMHYSLDGAMRIQSHQLYYHTHSGERFNLITTEATELKVHLAANPDVSVEINGVIQSLAISMVRPEITDGLHQIIRQLRMDVEPEKRTTPKGVKHKNVLRRAPDWLLRCHLEAKDFNFEVAGIDEDISDDTRGVSLHLDTIAAEYRAHRLDGLHRRLPRRRTHSRSITQSDSDITPSSSPRTRRKGQTHGDGRRLSFNIKGLEAQIMEGIDRLEVEPFVNIPRLEVLLSATSDSHGPMFNVQVSVRTVMMQYSLFRHYSVGVAGLTLRKAFMRSGREAPRAHEPSHFRANRLAPPSRSGVDPSITTPELVILDVKAALVQLKAEMPHDPLIMLRVYGLEAGRHRWSTPYMTSTLIRLYVQPPRMRNVWARMVGIKSGRLDLRETRHKTANGPVVEERLIDVSTEAIRIAVPHEVIVARISDNIVNVVKSVQQLHHRFKTGTNEYILEKKPEAPKRVPKIAVRSRNFLFEIEDGAFEWKLGMIYRAGRQEQVQRLAREEAFNLKIKKVQEEEARRGGSKLRSRSTFARGRVDNSSSTSWFRNRSADPYRHDRRTRSPRRGGLPTYDPEGGNRTVSGDAKVSESDARAHLDMFNAQSWKKRIDQACRLSQESIRELRETFWGPNHLPDDIQETENILEVPPRPALMSTMISDLHVVVDKPTFAMKDLPEFLYKVGKGMPRDMKYGLLVPMHIAINMNEARVTLRDYPLPVLHIPCLKSGQSSRQPSISLKTNFVLAEEFRGIESTRRVRVNVVPPKSSDPTASNEGGFAIEVRRTMGPVKSFTDVSMDINTALPTRITWSPCYQPAIQDMMMAIESFTKPPIDPSERVGFWDKLRLNFHSRIHVAWKGDGDVHLALKGTRDPYQVTGNGAGFLMCWRNEVRWNINADDNPKQFMTVDSGEYVLAVPDYSHQVRESARRRIEDGSHLAEDNLRQATAFKKVIMKLSGKVQWLAGLVFEKEIESGHRSFDFIPHYNVVLKNPHFAHSHGNLPYDAFRGFRSRHIHLSIAVRAPVDREWMSSNPVPSRSYNTIHLSPRFFTHFFTWWGLFSQPMSLPIRQGNLFPGREKSSKKFGRHLATVKYSILLAPLFLSHIYKHKDAEDYSQNEAVSATGLKVRFDSFMLDLHQRREEFNTLAKTKNSPSRTSGIKIHAGHLDLAAADIRAVSASLKGTTTEAIKKGSISSLITDQDDKPDLSHFTIPDDDLSWIDMDDFVELDWILPTEAHPDTKILPLAYAPRFTYFRQTDIGGVISGDPTRTSPFGNEPTHFCLLSQEDDNKKVQMELIQERLDQLEIQMLSHSRNVGEAELRLVQASTKDSSLLDDLDALKRHTGVLKDKKAFLENMLEQVRTKIGCGSNYIFPSSAARDSSPDGSSSEEQVMDIPPTSHFESEFNNRFVIHNMQLKWNNLLRNIVLRYIHQNSQRRGFVYYLSRRAIKFILDMVDEQNKTKTTQPAKSQATPAASSATDTPNIGKKAPQDLEDRIRSILEDGRRFSTTSHFLPNEDGSISGTIEDLECGISKDFSPQNSYHVRLIAPQIQLQSEKNKKHVVLITAKGMELKVVEIMDKDRISDTVSGLVQRRFLVNMDSTQFFVTHQKWFQTHLVSMYAGSRYGTPGGSAWPPWVPMEIMFDFQADPFGFKRVVQKTSAMLRFDKYNTLRLKYNAEVSTEENGDSDDQVTESRTDNLWVEFPQVRALCNSSQYYAMYVIVLDLLMYSEPLEKTRSERLEKIMLASDFSDLSGAPAMVMKLQERIKQLEEIKMHFQVYSKYLDKRGWEERLYLERDLAACEDELFFLMKAITTSQRKYDVNAESTPLVKWSIAAREIVWHLIQNTSDPLVEMQLKDVEYDRTDNSDGSHMNLIRVKKILGLNLLKDATYPEIIASYVDGEKVKNKDLNDKDMIRVYWHMLEAIAGIPVMDRFEVNLHPMKVQLEREAGQRLFEYIFPGMDGDKSSGGKHDTPAIIKTEADDDDTESLASSTSRLGTPGGLTADKESNFSTRPGSLELRLRPTLSSLGPEQDPSPNKAMSVYSTESQSGFRLFRSSGTGKTLVKKSSHDSLRAGRPGALGRTSTGFSTKDSRESETKKASRFNKSKKTDEKQSDDLTKMMDRASNYMTFAHIKMPSVVLCLSYKGKDQRNFEDVHDFVFRLPTIEWQNKTWSNLDLALALKKAVMKALISHTGAIIGNKFSKHRPNAEQRSKLREMANSSVLIAPLNTSGAASTYAGSINDSDDSSSLYGASPVDYSRSPPQSRGSAHGNMMPFPRSESRSSSVSGVSHTNGGSGQAGGGNVPAFLTMTPPTPVDGKNTEAGGFGLGIEYLRPSSSGGVAGSSHRRLLRNIPSGDSRPATSASNMSSTGQAESSSHSGEGRRKSGGGGFKGKISLFGRKSHRESSGKTEDDESGEEKSLRGKRLSWAQGRTKTG